MIYLIGGPPRCGKTIAARQLARRLGCSLLPTDYLASAVYRYIPDDEAEARYPALGRGASNDERFVRFPPAAMLAGFRIRARTIWPALAAIIEYALAEEQHYIFEGFHIEPEFARQQVAAHGQKRLRVAFLIKTDLADITTGLRAAREINDWARRHTLHEETYGHIAAWVQLYSAAISEEAARFDLPTFSTDGTFHERIRAVVEYLAA
jgi:2-phosphoglycerate kinase